MSNIYCNIAVSKRNNEKVKAVNQLIQEHTGQEIYSLDG